MSTGMAARWRITLSDGRDLGRELVKAGLAWWYRKYAAGDWGAEGTRGGYSPGWPWPVDRFGRRPTVGIGKACVTTRQGNFKMIRLFTLLVGGSMLLFSAPGENKAAEVRRNVQGIKATVAQLQDQIIALESQLVSEAGVPAAAKVAVVAPVAATPEGPSPWLVQQARTVVESARQQCKATTKRGSRCSRMAAAEKATCWQH